MTDRIKSLAKKLIGVPEESGPITITLGDESSAMLRWKTGDQHHVYIVKHDDDCIENAKTLIWLHAAHGWFDELQAECAIGIIDAVMT